jgi:hypothetical protein
VSQDDSTKGVGKRRLKYCLHLYMINIKVKKKSGDVDCYSVVNELMILFWLFHVLFLYE